MPFPTLGERLKGLISESWFYVKNGAPAAGAPARGTEVGPPERHLGERHREEESMKGGRTGGGGVGRGAGFARRTEQGPQIRATGSAWTAPASTGTSFGASAAASSFAWVKEPRRAASARKSVAAAA